MPLGSFDLLARATFPFLVGPDLFDGGPASDISRALSVAADTADYLYTWSIIIIVAMVHNLCSKMSQKSLCVGLMLE